MPDQMRRRIVHSAMLAPILVTVAGCERKLTPKDAKREGADFQLLTAAEAATLEAVADATIPGAKEAGLAHYVDAHLAVPSADSLLMIRYLDVPPPYADFYRPAIAAVDALTAQMFAKSAEELTAEEGQALVGAIASGIPDGWAGPPAPFFYFVLRSDAIDVTYGTQEGFMKLGIPYLPHIAPPSPW